MDKIERIERRLKLHDMRVLLSVAQAGSMHKAAETSRHLSARRVAINFRSRARARRSAVSIAAGAASSRPQYGRAIIKRGVAVFDELRQGVRDVEFLADPTAGELRIGCAEMTAAGPALAVMERLTRRHPRIVFNVVTGSVVSLYRNLAERNVETRDGCNLRRRSRRA